MNCGNCRFYKPLETAGRGECRRNPPALLMSPKSPGPQAGWPESNIDDWCGEWAGADRRKALGETEPEEP